MVILETAALATKVRPAETVQRARNGGAAAWRIHLSPGILPQALAAYRINTFKRAARACWGLESICLTHSLVAFTSGNDTASCTRTPPIRKHKNGCAQTGFEQLSKIPASKTRAKPLTIFPFPCYLMSMTALPKIPARMTVAEFFAWNPPSAQLWQLVDGEPQAMAPASITHGAIQNELGSLIRNHLDERSSPCRVITTPGVIPRVNSETNVRIPGLAVSCSGYDAEDSALADPVLLIEILSPNNQAETWANVWAYTTIPSVQEILVLKTAEIGGELLRRNPDGSWPSRLLPIAAGELTLESIGFCFSLATAYRTTRLTLKR